MGKELASKIESRIYDSNINDQTVTNLCYEAMRFGFHSVQVFPNMVELCKEVLEESQVKINALISYPHGGFTPEQKAMEALDAIERGADEVEVVMNTREVKSHHFDFVEREMKTVADAVRSREESKGVNVKFIIEIECLTSDEITEVCKRAKKAQIDYIVTSTGVYCALDKDRNDVLLYANTKEIAFIKSLVGEDVKIQAQGYIETYNHAIDLLEAGADRIATEYAKRVIQGGEE